MAIYFIQAGDDGPVKIGFTTNPLRRLDNIQTHHPEKLRIVKLYEGTKQEERELHVRFASQRINREWFAASVLEHAVDMPLAEVPKRGSKARKIHKPWSEDARRRASEKRRAKHADPIWREQHRKRVAFWRPVSRMAAQLSSLHHWLEKDPDLKSRFTREHVASVAHELEQIKARWPDALDRARHPEIPSQAAQASALFAAARALVARAQGAA